MDTLNPSLWATAAGNLARRAQADPAFHARCHQDPARAFREAAGFDLPSGLTLRFAEVQPGELVIPLPPLVPGRSGQPLSEAELEQVAGGTVPIACAIGILAAAAGTIWLASKI